jgi:hypothetical protein
MNINTFCLGFGCTRIDLPVSTSILGFLLLLSMFGYPSYNDGSKIAMMGVDAGFMGCHIYIMSLTLSKAFFSFISKQNEGIGIGIAVL